MTDIRRVFILLSMLATIVLPIGAQDTAAEGGRTSSLLVGMGWNNEYDTYLSPNEYSGHNIIIAHESMRHMRHRPMVSVYNNVEGWANKGKKTYGSGQELGATVNYSASILRRWDNTLWRGLSLSVGGACDAFFGGLYNTRNGNNPAQGYGGLSADATAMATYGFHIRRLPFSLRYSVALPLMGGMFSPHYGQSYYEIFDRDGWDHNIAFIHPGNALSLRQTFCIDVPVRRATVRLTYMSNLRQSEVNHIRQHHYNRSFLIGYVHDVRVLRHKNLRLP